MCLEEKISTINELYGLFEIMVSENAFLPEEVFEKNKELKEIAIENGLIKNQRYYDEIESFSKSKKKKFNSDIIKEYIKNNIKIEYDKNTKGYKHIKNKHYKSKEYKSFDEEVNLFEFINDTLLNEHRKIDFRLKDNKIITYINYNKKTSKNTKKTRVCTIIGKRGEIITSYVISDIKYCNELLKIKESDLTSNLVGNMYLDVNEEDNYFSLTDKGLNFFKLLKDKNLPKEIFDYMKGSELPPISPNCFSKKQIEKFSEIGIRFEEAIKKDKDIKNQKKIFEFAEIDEVNTKKEEIIDIINFEEDKVDEKTLIH